MKQLSVIKSTAHFKQENEMEKTHIFFRRTEKVSGTPEHTQRGMCLLGLHGSIRAPETQGAEQTYYIKLHLGGYRLENR